MTESNHGAAGGLPAAVLGNVVQLSHYRAPGHTRQNASPGTNSRVIFESRRAAVETGYLYPVLFEYICARLDVKICNKGTALDPARAAARSWNGPLPLVAPRRCAHGAMK